MGSEMGMGDVEVLLRVAGDSTGAQKAVSDMAQRTREATRTVAQQLREQGLSAAEAAEAYKSLGFTAEESTRQISAAFGNIPAALEPAKASVNTFGQAVRSNLGDLLVLRRAMYASFGLVSFGYIISEWGRMADGIKNAALAIGGFSSAAQKAFQQDIKARDDALIHFQGNTIKAQIATGQFLIHQTEMWQAAVEAQRKAADYRERFDEAILGPFVGRAFEYFTGNKLGKANDEAAKLNQRLVAQLQEMTKLEKQLQEEQTKAVVAAAHKQETAEHRLEASLIRVNGQLAAAQKQQAALSSEMDNYAARHLTQQIHQIEQESKQAQANIAKAKASQDALNIDIEKRGPLKGSASEMWAGSPRIDKMVLENNQRALKQWQKLVEEGNRKALASYQQLGEGVRGAFDTINQDLEMMGSRHLRTFGMVGSILQQSIEMEKRSAAASGAAAMSKTQFAIGALKQLAPVKAAVDVAKGLEALGDFNFWSAAQYFAGAAMWGTVGAAQIAGMVSGAGGGSRRGGSGSASRNNGGGSQSGGGSGSGDSGRQVVPSGNFATPPKNGNLTIAILGESEGGHWLAGILNKAVNQGGAELTATHTTAIPQPMA